MGIPDDFIFVNIKSATYDESKKQSWNTKKFEMEYLDENN
jgi:hypothetical protein